MVQQTPGECENRKMLGFSDLPKLGKRTVFFGFKGDSMELHITIFDSIVNKDYLEMKS